MPVEHKALVPAFSRDILAVELAENTVISYLNHSDSVLQLYEVSLIPYSKQSKYIKTNSLSKPAKRQKYMKLLPLTDSSLSVST